jgi:uroporphyrinogen-III synthase
MSLLQIVPRVGVKIPRRNYQAVCLTSVNAVRAIGDISSVFEVPAFAVGPQSLEAAHEAGFKHVEAHGGDVQGLVGYIKRNVDPKSGPLLYLSGAEISGDLAGSLKGVGFEVERLVCYDAKPQSLGDRAYEISKSQAVMLYSPRSARIWFDEVVKINLSVDAGKLIYFCLSANVAAALPQSWEKRIAREPTESAMLDLLD